MHSLHVACNVTKLGDNTSLPSNVSCDSPFHTIGIKSGLACYSDTYIGSIAIYFCLDCGFSSVQGLSTRTCLPNGSWTGQIPQCQCDTFSTVTASDVTALTTDVDSTHSFREHNANVYIPLIAVSSSSAVLICFILTFSTSLLMLFWMSRRRLQRELVETQENVDPIYEDIELNTTHNIAYKSVRR